jgi:hypothetical protein
LKRTKSFLHRRPVVLDVFAVDGAIGTDGGTARRAVPVIHFAAAIADTC